MVTKEDIRYAYRILLDRDPENDVVLERVFASRSDLRTAFLTSREFVASNPFLSPVIECWVIKESKHGFRIYVSLQDLHICRNILLDNYDEREVEVVKSIVHSGETVIDVGANIGFYTMLLATLVGRNGAVIAFEPLPFLHAAAVRSNIENGFDEICTIHNVALCDTRGLARIRRALGTVNFGGAHLAYDDPPANHVDEEVQLACLDDYAFGARCSFMKIDVEGAEPKVIRGGTDLLRRDRPIILSELHNPQLERVSGSNANEFIEMMRQFGYRCIQLDMHTELTSYGSGNPINILFVPTELATLAGHKGNCARPPTMKEF